MPLANEDPTVARKSHPVETLSPGLEAR